MWFSKTFYDGEGNSGVGGFGYFDATDRQYHLFTAPEVADYSISAICVEPYTVWMGTIYFGEYGGSPAGVLRYDRNTHLYTNMICRMSCTASSHLGTAYWPPLVQE